MRFQEHRDAARVYAQQQQPDHDGQRQYEQGAEVHAREPLIYQGAHDAYRDGDAHQRNDGPRDWDADERLVHAYNALGVLQQVQGVGGESVEAMYM